MDHAHPKRGHVREENWLLYQQPSTVQALKQGALHLSVLGFSLVFSCVGLVLALPPPWVRVFGDCPMAWRHWLTAALPDLQLLQYFHPLSQVFPEYMGQDLVLCVSFGDEHSSHHSFSTLSSAVGLCIRSHQVQTEAFLMRDESCTKLWIQRDVCRRNFDILYIQEPFLSWKNSITNIFLFYEGPNYVVFWFSMIFSLPGNETIFVREKFQIKLSLQERKRVGVKNSQSLPLTTSSIFPSGFLRLLMPHCLSPMQCVI